MPRFAAMCNVLFKCHRTLPWQMNSIFIIVLFLLVLPRNALPRLSSRSWQSQNARICKHIGTLRSLLRVFCKGFWDSCSLLWNYRLWQIRAEACKLVVAVSSKIGSKRERVTTKDFAVSFFMNILFLLGYSTWNELLWQSNQIFHITAIS